MNTRFAVILASFLAIPVTDVHAQESFPLPMPAAPRTVAVPQPVDNKLPNGLHVVSVATPGSGLVNVRLIVTAGSASDGGTGTAQAVAELLTKGTKTRTASQIADAIEQLGATLGAGAGYDSTTVSLGVLKSRLGAAMAIFADVAQSPAFPAAELTRYRTQTIDDLSVAYRQPGTLARLVAARVLFGDSGYAYPVTGTVATLGTITRADLTRFYGTRYLPSNAILVVSGDISAADAAALAARHFGAWKSLYPNNVAGVGGYGAMRVLPPPPPEKRRVVVIDRPDAGQAAVVVNRFGVRQDEGFYVAGLTRTVDSGLAGAVDPVIPELANDILGGGYSSRLNREVRVKRGLSYGAGSRLDARAERGPLTLSTQTKNETAGEAARVLVDELGKLGDAPPTVEEFTARKSALSGDFARSLETGAGLAGLVGELALYNLPLSQLQTYLSRVQAVTPEQVEGYAKNRFGADTANIVIVGNAAKFLPDLKARFPDDTVTVIPFAKLDLNSATLTKGGK